MKIIKIFVASMALFISTARAQFIKAELQVSGLTCSICSKATEKSLRSLGFISDIKTDLNRNVFVLTFNNSAPVSLYQISQKVQKAGFSVNNLKATFNFSNVKVNSNAFSFGGDTFYLTNSGDKTPTGQQAITVLDKGFAPASVYKKLTAQSNSADDKAGHIYHVAL